MHAKQINEQLNIQTDKFEVRPDFFHSGLIFNGKYLTSEQELIKKETFLKVVAFNNSYLPFARLSQSQKELFSKEIFELETIGYALKNEVEKQTNAPCSYYSEGLLRYLTTPPLISNYKSKKMGFINRIRKRLLTLAFSNYGFYE